LISLHQTIQNTGMIQVIMYEEFEDTKRDNQNPYIEEDQTTHWPKEKVQKDKQRSTKHTHKYTLNAYRNEYIHLEKILQH
jgi:uncharacterized protein YxeA